MDRRAEDGAHPGHEPRAQADGSPESTYTVEVPDRGFEVRVTVQVETRQDESEPTEAGYGHGV